MTTSYKIKFTPTPGATGTLIEYREVTAAAWTTPSNMPNPTTASEFPLELEQGKTYYVAVSAIHPRCSRRKALITISVPKPPDPVPCCPETYILSPDKTFCYKEETTAPEIISSGMCLAFSKTTSAYSSDGAWLYDAGTGVTLPQGSGKTHLTGTYWKGNPAGYGDEDNPESLPNESVMNRDSVWIDSDCNGSKDALAACAVLQFTCLVTLERARRLYVGIAGDNTFRLDVNNVTRILCGAGQGISQGPELPRCAVYPAANGEMLTNINFNIWHIVPVDLPAGPNYFTFSAIGDGSVNDALAAIIYDNTHEEIAAATRDEDLDIIFRTGNFKGQRVDIARCPDGWQLDTSGGVGNYVCRKITHTDVLTC